jgi:hypothetical protein
LKGTCGEKFKVTSSVYRPSIAIVVFAIVGVYLCEVNVPPQMLAPEKGHEKQSV